MFNKFKVNGFDVIHYKNNSKIGIVKFYINAGSLNEKPSDYGVAHFLEHVMFKGTTKRSVDALKRDAARIGNINAFTDHDITCYFLDFMIKEMDDAVELVSDMVFNALIPKDEVVRERGVILEEYQTIQDNPDAYYYDKLKENLFGGVGHPIIGTSKVISTMTKSKIDAFKNTHYAKNNMIIVVVGGMKEEAVKASLKKFLPKDFKEEAEESKIKKPKLNWDDFEFTHTSEQAIISLVYKVKTLQENSEDRFLRSVFSNGFGGGMHSILFDVIREKLGLCYSIYTHKFDHKHFGAGLITCNLDKKNIDLALEEIAKAIENVKTNGFSKDFLDLVKRNATLDAIKAFDNTWGVAHIADSCFKDPKLFTLKDYESGVKKIKNDDIVRYANEIFGDRIKTVKMVGK